MHPTFFFKLEHACCFAYALDRNPQISTCIVLKKISPVLTSENPRGVAFAKEEKASNMPIYKQIMIHDEYSFCQTGSSVFTFHFL